MGFFDKILDRFGSAEATRKSLKKNYEKYRKKALKRGTKPYDAHLDAVSRLLVARTSSPLSTYKVNKAKMMSEVYPFLQKGPNISLPLLIEYILYLEDDPAVKNDFLKNGINEIIKEFLDKESKIDKEIFSEHLDVINVAIGLDIPWTRLVQVGYLDKILNPNNRNENKNSQDNKTQKKKRNSNSSNTTDPRITVENSKPISYEMLKAYEKYNGNIAKLKTDGTEVEKDLVGSNEFNAINSLKQYSHLVENELTSKSYSEKIINVLIERTSGEKAIKYFSIKAWQEYNSKS